MNHVRIHIEAIRSSYWFVPSIMALFAIMLGILLIWFDARNGDSYIAGISWYQQVRSEGAREVLSTIAGSMITVAGVVFSITIVALSYASSQYGPRVLTNFMSDRGNTVTLGTFIATFLYSLVVLRTIRGGDDSFVPQYAVMVAMLLATCSIGVLIYFIHHVLQSIHINNVVARIGRQLIDGVKDRFPSVVSDEAECGDHRTPPTPEGERRTVNACLTGYIQRIDGDKLVHLARESDVTIILRCATGDFLFEGVALATVIPAGRWTGADDGSLQLCFTVGDKRTPENDLPFLVSELVEIATRALSPGVNDPITAMTCLDWLGAGGAEYQRRRMRGSVRSDDEGAVRLIAEPDDFGTFVRRSFGQLRPYAAKDVLVARHVMDVLGKLASVANDQSQIDELRGEASRLAEQAELSLHGPSQRAARDHAAALQARLALGLAVLKQD